MSENINHDIIIDPIKKHTDDRGTIDQLYNDNLPFKVKRIYRICPIKGIIRAFHGHKKEYKAFIVLRGIVKFVICEMNDKTEKEIHYDVFVFRAGDDILIVPPGCYNGFVAITDDVDMLGFSSSTLEESQKDDFRKSPFAYGKEMWRTDHR